MVNVMKDASIGTARSLACVQLSSIRLASYLVWSVDSFREKLSTKERRIQDNMTLSERSDLECLDMAPESVDQSTFPTW